MRDYTKRISVQLSSEVAVRLDAWCLAHDRSLSWAISHLTGKGLDAEGWPAADSAERAQHPPEE